MIKGICIAILSLYANMVIIDGRSGIVKFFRPEGYSTRGRDAGYILREEGVSEKEYEGQWPGCNRFWVWKFSAIRRLRKNVFPL